MVAISCYYNHYNYESIKCIFITYLNYVKIILNEKSIIISKIQLKSNIKLFQMYILSLFYTKDTSQVEIIGEKLKINKNKRIYNIYARKVWKHLGLNEYYESITIKEDYYRNSNDPLDKIAQPKYTRNPFNTQEPKRTSSDKKIKKFIKHLNDVTFLKYDTNNFEMMLNECYLNELKDICEYFQSYIDYKNQVDIFAMFSATYGIDITNSIIKQM
jgi:hypothetical protein